MIKTTKKINQEEEQKQNLLFWAGKSHSERLNAIQELREQYIVLFNKIEEYNESRARLRRVCRIVKQV